MLKHVFVFDVDNILDFDRWYFRYHSKECMRFFGPWLRRYETYRAFDAPVEADGFGVRRGRMTELWYSSVEDFIEAKPNERPYTGYAGQSTRSKPGAVTMVPAMPTEDFLGIEPKPEEKSIIRWYIVFRYPDGVHVDEGEEWYLNTHTQEAKELPGLLKYVSHRVLQDAPITTPYHRLTELWFESIDAWKSAVIDSPLLKEMTPPPWDADKGKLISVSTFIPYKPDVDFLRDNPSIP